jgi:hypothetical protein
MNGVRNMELVRIGDILYTVVSKDEEFGVKTVEWFEGCDYENKTRRTVGIDVGETFESKFEVGDHVNYVDEGSRTGTLVVAGYSGTYHRHGTSLPVVFTKKTWAPEEGFELQDNSVTFGRELDTLSLTWLDSEELYDLCKRMLKHIRTLEG